MIKELEQLLYVSSNVEYNILEVDLVFCDNVSHIISHIFQYILSHEILLNNPFESHQHLSMEQGIAQN